MQVAQNLPTTVLEKYKNIFFKLVYFFSPIITRPSCALDRRTILCLYVPGFQIQAFKHDKSLLECSKRIKEQKKNEGSVLVEESAYNSQIAQLGLVMMV